MEKLYCDRCHKIDQDCGSMVYIQIGVLRYTNLRKSLEDDKSGKTRAIDRAYALKNDFALCDDCYIDFMDYKTGKPGVIDESEPTTGELKDPTPTENY